MKWTERWVVTFRCDLCDLWRRCNWFTFSFIIAEVENSKWTGTANCTFGLLGFVLYISYVYNPAIMEEWERDMEIEKNTPGTALYDLYNNNKD